MPTKSAKSPDAAKPSRSGARRRPASTRQAGRQPQPDHRAIAERAYFIHLEDGSSDQLANWLRAERELATV